MKDNEDSIWQDGFFAESVSPKEIKEKQKTIHMGHDEDINYNCKKCNKKISAHNKDWHAHMCDECFNQEHFNEEGNIQEIDKEMKQELESFNPKEHSTAELLEENGTGLISINDNNMEAFLPILMAVEETICQYFAENTSLKDSYVIESLKRIRDTFTSESKFDGLKGKIVDKLKLVLFLNNYDINDVSLSISKVIKSVKTHRSIGGSRGYLNFISDFFNQM
ncbi:MAG: hypothetical protein KJ583_00250 [Nanoarchaeota archaeon]|nr:hypothetical protein [Nanoarchaeota archaeon]MBU1269629.1 hypothetical protein [Nanoarchaeota archaeon]MBU1603719.1 hypothetical protein [Nanoarchaeota archaeon]MBU2442743.1 hypothetical protein [Nanoarchaeota archaeon]